ncbi:MAG: LegC family aminotransferase [Gammaproteobacteria bacterium]|nr:LegC family aminotransferase [Gammaproteobacteria bacterium]
MNKEIDINKIVSKLRSVLPASCGTISLHEPSFKGNEWKYIKECLDTGWVSSVGKYVDEFEYKLAEFTGVKRAVAVANGTAALHICLKLVGVRDNDEVLMPALTFVATANAVAYCNAVPHFVDSEERTLGIDPFKLKKYLAEISEIRAGACFNKKTGCRIKAVIPMHTFGHPVDLDPLIDVCSLYKLELIEDAAESLGSYYKERHTGNFGKLSALSFNGNKIITTGGGGAILTNDEELGKLAKHITTTAKLPHKWNFYHDMVGYNYRMPNINAALGCAQLEQLPFFIEKKRRVTENYKKVFSGIDGIQLFQEPKFARSNYWLNVLLLDEKNAPMRDALLEGTNNAGILARPAWVLMNQLPMFKDCPHMDLHISEKLEKRLINIPSSPELS